MTTSRALIDRDDTTAATARATGLAYLGIVASGLFAEFFVRMSLVVPGDAAATAASIAGSPGLFRAGVAADALMVGLAGAVAIGLFRLLRHVDRRLALLATAARLVQAAVLLANLANLLRAAARAGDAVAGVPGAADAALDAMATHALVYDVGLVAFGVSCLALAALLRRASVVPAWLGHGMAATGVVYLAGSFAALVMPSLSAAIDPLYAIAIVVEPAFALWLVLRGGRLVAAPATPPAAVPALA